MVLPRLDRFTIVDATLTEHAKWLQVFRPPHLHTLELRTQAALESRFPPDTAQRWAASLFFHPHISEWHMPSSVQKLVLGDWRVKSQAAILLLLLPDIECLQLRCTKPTNLNRTAALLSKIDDIGHPQYPRKLQVVSIHNARTWRTKLQIMLSVRSQLGILSLKKLQLSNVTITDTIMMWEYAPEVPNGVVLESWQPPWV